MFNAVQLFFKKIWDIVLFPAIIFVFIGLLFWAIVSIVGCDARTRADNTSLADADRQLGEYRAELDRERRTIENLETTIEGLTESNIFLQDSLDRASQTIDDISGTISGLEKLQGSNLEKLRGVVTGLKQIQESIKGLGDS